jgi:flagellar basal-body rod modification protein FlgD
MSTQAVASSAAAAASATSTASTSTSGSSVLSQNDFLKLLMTQLQNQDPLNPTDTNSFVQEMCQLTSTQAITQMGTDINNLVTSMQGGAMGQWASAIGDYMKVSSTSISQGDQVTLSPSGSYDSLTLTLKDSSGNETTKTYGSSDTPVYSDTNGSYTIVGATQTKNGVSSACSYNVYRLISAVQSGASGTSLVASDGTAYPTASVTQITK